MGERAIEIVVLDAGGGDTLTEVTVRDPDGSATAHRVTVRRAALSMIPPGRPVEALVRASFEFLLEREPKESILRTFDIEVIGRYFPEYECEITQRLR
jgi:hypothetical protein